MYRGTCSCGCGAVAIRRTQHSRSGRHSTSPMTPPTGIDGLDAFTPARASGNLGFIDLQLNAQRRQRFRAALPGDRARARRQRPS